MQLNRLIQAILFALVIIGIFASMAKNSYGFTFIAVACFGLALLYLIQLVWKLIEDQANLSKNDVWSLAELFLLASLLILFGLRAFYIYIQGGEFIFMGVCLLMMVVYAFIAFQTFSSVKAENKALAWNLVSIYASVLFFLLSMLTRILTTWSLLFGAIGILASLPMLMAVVRNQKYEVSGKLISFFQFLNTSKSKVGLLFLFFISSALYTGLSQVNFIPEIENSDRPKAYIELINDAESGKENTVDGKYKHEKYKEAMDTFLARHQSKN